jgi:hypothetical protein
MTKCLIFLAILAISRASPIENSPNLVALFTGVFEHADELPMNDNLEELKTSDRSCVWEKLKLQRNEAIEAAVVNDFEEFKSQSARNRKIVRAAHKAANLCENEEKSLNHFRTMIDIGMVFYKPGDLGCTKLDLQKIDPKSKLLEGFTSSKTDEECSKITKEREENVSSSEQDEESEAAELNIQSCTSEQFDDDLEGKRIMLVVKILAGTSEVNEEKITESAKYLKKTTDEKIEKQLSCIMMDLGVE